MNIFAEMKKYLFHVLGPKNYLKALHVSFHGLYSMRALKGNYVYKYHYFDKHVIQKGDFILDIGANLGYYTKLFARWTGDTGHVHAVEPVAMFADTIKWGTQKQRNVTVHNVALGEAEKEVALSTPGKYGYLRTGLARIFPPEEAQPSYEFTFKATMKKGSELFANLHRLDFIKCDIEGYEEFVFPEMKSLLIKYKPVIQVETWGQQKARVENFLKSIGYKIYDVEDGVLKPIEESKQELPGDLFFIHKDNASVIDRLRKMKLAS